MDFRRRVVVASDALESYVKVVLLDENDRGSDFYLPLEIGSPWPKIYGTQFGKYITIQTSAPTSN